MQTVITSNQLLDEVVKAGSGSIDIYGYIV